MKRMVSLVLLCVMLCGILPLAVSCGKEDQSGEWGAYYKAFRAFTGEMKKNTRYLCLDNTGIEEENQKKLYDLFYEYCKDKRFSLFEGEWMELYGRKLLSDDGSFTDGYLVSFPEAVWSDDRTQVTVTVSMRRTASVSTENLGGTVTVTKSGNGWTAVKTEGGSAIAEKAGAYLAVYQYYVENAGMNSLKSILALDPGGAEEDVLPTLSKQLSSLAGKQNFRYMEASWSELKSDGYIDEAGDFAEGYHLTYETVSWQDEGCVEITSWMTQGDLNALGGVFTVEWTGSAWEVTDVQEMMS